MIYLAFALGLVIGCTLGIVLMACLFVAREADEGRAAFHKKTATRDALRRGWGR